MTILRYLVLAIVFGLCMSLPYGQLRFVADDHSNKHTYRNENTEAYDKPTTGNCFPEMFQGDMNAHWACITQFALQSNWFPSPISGLYSYLDWNSFDGFWQNGAVLETLTNFAFYANNTRYRSAILSSYRNLTELLLAYQPQPSFDDEAWFGLSYARIYEVFGDRRFLETALAIYNWCWEVGWDSSGQCNGGFWFDGRYSDKVTITNAELLQLGAKLYRLTGSKDLEIMGRLNKTWNYFLANKIVNPNSFGVSDGIDLYTCAPNNVYKYTYNSGVLIGSLAEIFKVTGDESKLILAHKIANATIISMSKDGILNEYCDEDGCSSNSDAKMFKGIFVRNLRYLMDVSDRDRQALYRQWLQGNIDSVINNTRCQKDIHYCNVTLQDGKPFYNLTGPVFDSNWRGPYVVSSPAQQTSVLDLFISGIEYGTKCVGESCFFDPPIPAIKPLTCSDSPCPPDRQCCSFFTGYQTCCMPWESCVSGGCYSN